MTQEVLSILELLRPLIQVVKTPERSEFIGQEEGDLQAMLLQLHGVAQALANHTHIPQVRSHPGNQATNQGKLTNSNNRPVMYRQGRQGRFFKSNK